MDPNYKAPAPAPHDASLSRAERRRLERGQPEDATTGKLGCKFCMSTVGQFFKSSNHFRCRTPNCRGNY